MKLGLNSETESSDSSESGLSESSGLDVKKSSKVQKRRKKSLKSGLHQKSADSVKFPQIWPHAALPWVVADPLKVTGGVPAISLFISFELAMGAAMFVFVSLTCTCPLLDFLLPFLLRFLSGVFSSCWLDIDYILIVQPSKSLSMFKTQRNTTFYNFLYSSLKS